MLTDTEVLDALEAIVAEKGEDYTYPESEKRHGTCQYQTYDEDGWVPTGPSCLIGHLILRAQLMEPEGLRDYEGNAAVDFLDGYMTSAAVKACAEAQTAQDQGQTWGVALDLARTALGYQTV